MVYTAGVCCPIVLEAGSLTRRHSLGWFLMIVPLSWLWCLLVVLGVPGFQKNHVISASSSHDLILFSHHHLSPTFVCFLCIYFSPFYTQPCHPQRPCFPMKSHSQVIKDKDLLSFLGAQLNLQQLLIYGSPNLYEYMKPR